MYMCPYCIELLIMCYFSVIVENNVQLSYVILRTYAVYQLLLKSYIGNKGTRCDHRVRHICKMEKLEIRAVLKYICKKGMPPKEIHEDFMETLQKESPSYNTVKKWAAGFLRGYRALRMMDGQAAPKMPPLIKMSRVCIPWLCVIGGETCEA